MSTEKGKGQYFYIGNRKTERPDAELVGKGALCAILHRKNEWLKKLKSVGFCQNRETNALFYLKLR